MTPRIIAHRGASDRAPENTLSAVRLAVLDGCDGVECDVQWSRDGTPMVHHDSTLERGSGRRVRVDALSTAALRATSVHIEGRFGAPRTIPTLAEWFDAVPERCEALVECKPQGGDRLERQRLDLLIDELPAREVRLISFSAAMVAHAQKRLSPTTPVGAIAGSRATPDEVASALDCSRGLLVVHARHLSSALARRVETAGLELYAYPLDDAASLRRALDLGVRGLITNRPAFARQWVPRAAH